MTDRLDDAALAAIKARHEQTVQIITNWHAWAALPPDAEIAHADRAALLAGVERLRADLDRVTRGTWSKELARLSADAAALREALGGLIDAFESALDTRRCKLSDLRKLNQARAAHARAGGGS